MLMIVGYAQGFFFQQQQRPEPSSWEDQVLNNDCDRYLCTDTLTCVDSLKDCPCPFGKSQLKCMLPSEQRPYICISKPATHDKSLNEIYDDPNRGPAAKIQGMRDCGWVLENFKV